MGPAMANRLPGDGWSQQGTDFHAQGLGRRQERLDAGGLPYPALQLGYFDQDEYLEIGDADLRRE